MIPEPFAGALPGLVGAGLAGLVGSPHCIGMCGGFAASAGAQRGGALAWTAGRLGTYAALGAAAGGLGGAVPGPAWLGEALSVVFLAWFAAGLAGLSPHLALPAPAALQRAGARLIGRTDVLGRVAFGAVNGLLPCGLVYAALAFPVAAGSPAAGALSMVAFGLGTAPALALAALGLRRLTARSLGARRALALGVLVMGLGSLALRPAPPAAPTASPAGAAAAAR
jgi:sulfite exporter TauE/SafE